MLHGRAVIELHNNKTHRDERIVHDNMLTNWIRDSMRGISNVNLGLTEMFNVNKENLFKGLMMFDTPLSNDASDYLFPKPSVARMVAHGDGVAYSGSDYTRGSYNASQSSSSAGSVTYTWDFTQEQGNGTIASLGLCNPNFARIGSGQLVQTAANTTEKILLPRIDKSSLSLTSSTNMNTVCYNGKMYTVTFSSSVLTVVKKNLCSKVYNPVRDWLSKLTTQARALADLVTEETATTDLSSALGSVSKIAIGFVSGKLYILAATANWSNGSTKTLVVYDLESKQYTTQVITNNTGKTLYLSNWWSDNVIGQIAVYDGYLYIDSTDKNLCYIKLSDNTDAGVVTLPDGTTQVSMTLDFNSRMRMGFCEMGNLMVYIPAYAASSSAQQYYFLDGRTAYPNNLLSIGYVASGQEYGYNIGDADGVYKLFTSTNTTYTYALPCLTTKNNLESAVTKTADMTMRVTYTVTDQAE